MQHVVMLAIRMLTKPLICPDSKPDVMTHRILPMSPVAQDRQRPAVDQDLRRPAKIILRKTMMFSAVLHAREVPPVKVTKMT
jgi:hypothetical protein